MTDKSPTALSLDALRARIDALDLEILALLNERARCALDVAEVDILVLKQAGLIANLAKRVKVIKTLQPGKGVLHMEFEPRGEEVWISVRDRDLVQVYDTASFTLRTELPARKPSGIFLTARAHRIGL